MSEKPARRAEPNTGTSKLTGADSTDAQLPSDLVAEMAGPYTFPNVRRRMIGAIGYLILGGVLACGGWVWSAPAYNRGFVVAGLALIVIGGYVAYASWPLRIKESVAVESASRALGFAVGPASVSIGWRGLASRPVWRILAYSHEAPPKRRGLAIIDAVDGEVLSVLEESNPEDWLEVEDDAAKKAR